MRYRLTGHVRDIHALDSFSLEIDPNGRLVFSAAIPSSLALRIAPDSPVRDTEGLRDTKVTCIIVDSQRRPMLARVHRCADAAVAC
jgi:hypothetical protein